MNVANPYQLLGLESDATEEQIRKAYRKLAAQHHPDKGGDPEQFRAIEEAYAFLKEEKNRKLFADCGVFNPRHGHDVVKCATTIFLKQAALMRMGHCGDPIALTIEVLTKNQWNLRDQIKSVKGQIFEVEQTIRSLQKDGAALTDFDPLQLALKAVIFEATGNLNGLIYNEQIQKDAEDFIKGYAMAAAKRREHENVGWDYSKLMASSK